MSRITLARFHLQRPLSQKKRAGTTDETWERGWDHACTAAQSTSSVEYHATTQWQKENNEFVPRILFPEGLGQLVLQHSKIPALPIES